MQSSAKNILCRNKFLSKNQLKLLIDRLKKVDN